jgi:hypothetical protein
VLGRGIHLFGEAEQAVPLKLQRAKVIRSGVVLNYLQPAAVIWTNGLFRACSVHVSNPILNAIGNVDADSRWLHNADRHSVSNAVSNADELDPSCKNFSELKLLQLKRTGRQERLVSWWTSWSLSFWGP